MHLVSWVLAVVGTIIRTAAGIVLSPGTLHLLGVHSLALSTDCSDAERLVALDLDMAGQVSTCLVGANHERVEVFRLDLLLQVATLRLVRILKGKYEG